MNSATVRPSPRNLPRKGDQSDPGIAPVISPSPASRSRHASSPAKNTMMSGMINQRLSSSDKDPVNSPMTRMVAGMRRAPPDSI